MLRDLAWVYCIALFKCKAQEPAVTLSKGLLVAAEEEREWGRAGWLGEMVAYGACGPSSLHRSLNMGSRLVGSSSEGDPSPREINSARTGSNLLPT